MSRVEEHYALPYGVGPGVVPFIDVDLILQEISSQMANSQLVRPQSIHSNLTSSASLRRRPARISKTNSAGNSPHGLERRKSSASHVVARAISSLEDRCVRTLSSGRATIKRSNRPITMERPTTWHSSSITSGLPEPTTTTFRNLANQSMTENRVSSSRPSDINGLSAFATQVHMDPNVPLNPYFNLATSFEVDDQSRIPFVDQHESIFDPRGASYPPEPNELSNYSSFPHMTPLQEPVTYRHAPYPDQDWTQVFPSEVPWTTAYRAPHYPPTQAFPTSLRNPSTALRPRPLKEQNKELIGMGLYDSPEQDLFSRSLIFGDGSGFTPPCDTLHPRQESLGKGLKLEETWQPPIGQEEEDEDEVEDEADEDCSTEEGEEEPALGHDLLLVGQQQAGLPIYGDLSNRSFFFDNDENFINDIAFDQTFSFAQHKARDTAMEHAAWL